LSRSFGDLSKRQRAATTSDLVNSPTVGKSNPYSFSGKLGWKNCTAKTRLPPFGNCC
jgi:hypothetical protein